jgi:hypothetical protein
MKYLYCTIAVGEKYLNSAKEISRRLNEKSENHHFLIVTDKPEENYENTTFVGIPKEQVVFIRNEFNYCLKYYPLYLAKDMEYNNIIYIDSDWRIKDEYDEAGVMNMLNFMNENEYDILFERPHTIGAGKFDGRECFWGHKRDFYNIMETNEYDEGHVCNEQFIVFKKNDKFNVFIEKWKELYQIAANAELWAFAEGTEIGMSMAVAKLKYSIITWEKYIKHMYEFTSKDGGISIKFQ